MVLVQFHEQEYETIGCYPEMIFMTGFLRPVFKFVTLVKMSVGWFGCFPLFPLFISTKVMTHCQYSFGRILER